MARFVPNPRGMAELERKIKASTEAAVERAARTQAGKPVEVVLAELERELRSVGVEPNPSALRPLAEKISKDGTLPGHTQDTPGRPGSTRTDSD